MEVKPAWKTTEFWVNFAVTVVGLLMASGVFAEESQTARILGAIMAMIAPLVQTQSRTQIKTAALRAPLTVPIPGIPLDAGK